MSLYYNDVIFEKFEDAVEALDRVYEIARDYYRVSKADLYDICGLVASYKDSKRYWTEPMLRNEARIERIDGGWTIELPIPIPDIPAARKPTKHNPEPQPMYITIHSKDVSNLSEVLSEITQQASEIKDRVINITIM